MQNHVLLKKLGRDLLHRKGSLVALALIVTIGVGCYVGMAAVWRDLDGSRQRYYTDHRLADFTVDLKRAPQWAVRSVEALPNVATARGRVSAPVLIDLPGVDQPITGTAISMPEQHGPVLNDIQMRSGTWFSTRDAREAILNDAFAKARGLQPGSRIRVLFVDKQHELLVVGTAMSPEFVCLISSGGGFVPDPANFGVMYLPETFLQESADLQSAYNQIVGLVHDRSKTALGNTLELIEDRLDAFGVTFTTPADQQPSVRYLADELAGLKVGATVTPGIFLGVAALILNVLMKRIVKSQRTTIGTLLALGYSRAAVTRHYLAHGLLFGLAGGIPGVLFGVWIENAMLNMYRVFFALPVIEPHFYPDLFAFGIGISVLCALIGTLQGIRYAVRLEPAEAMRPPPPERGRKILPESIPMLWQRLPFRSRMILRAVFRNPFRSAVSVLASTIATGIIFMSLSNVSAFDRMMQHEFTEVSHQDVSVVLRDPKGGKNAQSEVEGFPLISQSEPQLAIVCDLQNGPYKKRAGIIGMNSSSKLFTPLDREGKPIVIPEAGLVLSKKLAEILAVGTGDVLRLRPLMARREEVTSPIVAIVDTYFGLSAYANLEYLSRLIGEEAAANTLLGRFFKSSSEVAFLKSVKERPSVVGLNRRERALQLVDESLGETMGQMISIMVLFAGAIAFGSVLNATLVSLSERQREVGTLQVLGYTPAQVSSIFSGESLLLNGIGIVLGFFAGIGLAYGLSSLYSTELYRFPTVIKASNLIFSGFLMVVFIILAQLIVYRLVRKFDWLEVLKVKE